MPRHMLQIVTLLFVFNHTLTLISLLLDQAIVTILRIFVVVVLALAAIGPRQ